MNLDQGPDGACVGFSWTHELAAMPEIVDVSYDYAMALYRRAQQLDEWEGEAYEGTSVLAGAKAVLEAGHLYEYRWGFGISDVLQTLSQFGPMILGINWYESMFIPNINGVLSVSGDVAGGHAILCRAIDVVERMVLLHNSWGPRWALSGCAWLSWDNLERLLGEDGEACVPLVRVLQPTPEPEPAPEEKPGCLSAEGLRQMFRRERKERWI